MKERALADNVIVEMIEEDNKSESGILLSSSGKVESQRAKVLSVGDGVALKNGSKRPLLVSEGDVVFLSERAGHKATLSGKKVVIVKEAEIIAVLEDE